MPADQLSDTFAALADPTRREILGRLAEGEATVNELAEPFPGHTQAVSRHLKVLEHAGLISAAARRGRADASRRADEETPPSGSSRYGLFWERASTASPIACAVIIAHELDIRIRAPSTHRPRSCGAEWTEPERFADWFGGPRPRCRSPSVTMDVRPGGALARDDVRRRRPPRAPVGRRVPRGAAASRLTSR